MDSRGPPWHSSGLLPVDRLLFRSMHAEPEGACQGQGKDNQD